MNDRVIPFLLICLKKGQEPGLTLSKGAEAYITVHDFVKTVNRSRCFIKRGKAEVLSCSAWADPGVGEKPEQVERKPKVAAKIFFLRSAGWVTDVLLNS